MGEKELWDKLSYVGEKMIYDKKKKYFVIFHYLLNPVLEF